MSCVDFKVRRFCWVLWRKTESPMAGATKKSKLYFVCPTRPGDPNVVDRALVYCTRCFVRVWECVRGEMCKYGERREWRMENGAA